MCIRDSRCCEYTRRIAPSVRIAFVSFFIHNLKASILPGLISGFLDVYKRQDLCTVDGKIYSIPNLASSSFAVYNKNVLKEAMRLSIRDEGKRLDGRKTTEIRPIWCEVGPLPGPHGSAIFTRGETQSLTSVTLGTKLDEKIIDRCV